jgi:hypothetical protein
MSMKADLLDSMLHECDIAIHLHGKIPDGGLDYRPSEEQRSTLELLRYLSFCGLGFVDALESGNWDGYTAMSNESEGMAAEDFPAAMERQKEGLRERLGGITDDDLANREAQMPWGASFTLGRALLSLAYSSLAAYRMQLFLYAKAAGNPDLKTPNCWAGVDMKT